MEIPGFVTALRYGLGSQAINFCQVYQINFSSVHHIHVSCILLRHNITDVRDIIHISLDLLASDFQKFGCVLKNYIQFS